MSGGDWKAMFRGIQEGDLELVKFYLNQGIDPNYQHPEYMALPLSESIRYDHLEIIELLLANGAKTDIIEMESVLTSLQLAKKLQKQKAVDLMEVFTQRK